MTPQAAKRAVPAIWVTSKLLAAVLDVLRLAEQRPALQRSAPRTGLPIRRRPEKRRVREKGADDLLCAFRRAGRRHSKALHEGWLAAARVDSSSVLLYMGLTLGVQRLVRAARGLRPSQIGTLSSPEGQR